VKILLRHGLAGKIATDSWKRHRIILLFKKKSGTNETFLKFVRPTIFLQLANSIFHVQK
jgi:hypothetical protein